LWISQATFFRFSMSSEKLSARSISGTEVAGWGGS